jgi:hypothetical protein
MRSTLATGVFIILVIVQDAFFGQICKAVLNLDLMPLRKDA